MRAVRSARLSLEPDGDGIITYAQSFYEYKGARRPSVERSERFLQLFGERPPVDVRVVAITGTNGKGTTAVTTERLLISRGMQTICLTSPHVYSVRERIRINGAPVTWAVLADVVASMAPMLERMRNTQWHPSPIDVWTWAAIVVHMSKLPAIGGVFEVGRGGRSDATNVFTCPIVGLTGIASDHLLDFGGTYRSLLIEKAGLAKRGSRLYAIEIPPELDTCLASYCGDNGVYLLRPPYPPAGNLDNVERGHLALSHALASEFGVTDVAERAAELPCRLQSRDVDGRAFLLDVSHNVQSMDRLAAHVAAFADDVCVIVATQSDKDWRRMLDILMRTQVVREVCCCGLTTGRPVDPTEMEAYARGRGTTATAFAGLVSCLRYALTRPWRRYVVTGSFKVFRDFELALHRIGLAQYAIPTNELDPPRSWMRALV